ncbi:MAG: DUF4402 domain-containing protein [Sphingomicrobium sp.]
MRLTLKLAALAAVLTTASPALAAVSANAVADAKGLVLQPLTLTKVSDLDFGTVISTVVAGTVVIDADTGGRTVTGGVTPIPAYPGGRAVFAGAGTAGEAVNLTLNAPSVLVSTTNPSDTLIVNNLALDNGGAILRTIDPTSVFFVGVGGSFGIAASQANGLYVAQFDVTADYQ